MNALSLPGRCLVVAGLATAAVLGQQPAGAAPRFDRVLWCAELGRGARLAKDLGFTAVQLGRGGDPAVPRGLGLGFYLDQPIGKGLLEVRDDQWQPVRDAYEASRDPAVLVRPACFATPGVVGKAAVDAAAEAARVRGPGLSFVALADEPSATRHDAPLDTCRCPHCLRAFRAFVQRRHPTLAAANEALGSQFAAFASLEPPSTDQVRRRELGDVAIPVDLRAFGLWLDFVDAQYADAVAAIAAAVRGEVPGTPVGITGLSAPAAFGGADPARLWPGLTLLEPYSVGGAPELARSLAPTAARYATLAPPDGQALASLPLDAWVRASVAAMAADGLAGVVLWNDGTVAADGVPTPFGRAVQSAFAAFATELDACAQATFAPSPVWVVESQPSVRTWWMLDSAGDGMTWVRRLASYERTHSTSQSARVGWSRLLQDLGLQPEFVPAAALPERLLRARPRCLVLPATIAMSDRTAQAVLAYVQNGGVVVADHATGLYDDDLRRRNGGVLDELFGITQRSLQWDDLWVREGRATSRERGLPLAERGLRGAVGERRADGDANVERTTGRGRAVYLNAPVVEYPRWRLDPAAVEPAKELRRRVRAALRTAGATPVCELRGEGLPTCLARTLLRTRDGREVLVLRVNALEAPAMLQQLGADGARPIRLELPVSRRLRTLRGDDLGEGTAFDLQLDPFGALFLEVRR